MAQTIDIADLTGAGRQDKLVSKVNVTFGTAGDTASTGTLRMLAIPAGAIVTGGYINVKDATTASVDLHIGDGDDDNRYADNIDGAATGLTALTITGYQYTADDTIDIMIDTAAPAAAGSADVVVEYIIDGRSAFVQK